MAGSVNKVILVGNLGRDPEIKQFPSGDKVANFAIVTSDTWRDKQSGEKKERTEWHNIVVRGDGLVRVVENYVKKGSKLYIEGSLHTRKWQDKDGNDRYTTEIVVGGFGGTLTMLDSRNAGGGDFNNPEPSANMSMQDVRSFAADIGGNIIDDDIPF